MGLNFDLIVAIYTEAVRPYETCDIPCNLAERQHYLTKATPISKQVGRSESRVRDMRYI